MHITIEPHGADGNGGSPARGSFLEYLAEVARLDEDVLLWGPGEMEKELGARFIHEYSRRRGGPFVVAGCAAASRGRLEELLFAPALPLDPAGRTTGGGLVAAAERGTLFLENVEVLAPEDQMKLARFLKRRSYRRTGETRLRRADVRVIAATSAGPSGGSDRPRLHPTLTAHLEPVPLKIYAASRDVAPLALLLAGLVADFARTSGFPDMVPDEAVWPRLAAYPWPGGIQELEDYVRRLIDGAAANTANTAEPANRPVGDDASQEPAQPAAVNPAVLLRRLREKLEAMRASKPPT